MENQTAQDDEDFIQTKYGYCFYTFAPYPLIYNLYTHPQYRRQGHSKLLLELVIEVIRRTGHNGAINIQASPREGSIGREDLIKYYKSLGLDVENKQED